MSRPAEPRVNVREAQPDEAETVLAVWRAADSAPSVTDTVESVRAAAARDGTWLLVAEEDGRVVGTVLAAWDGWRGHFYRLAVLPEHRRRGIGLALVREAEERLRGAGARRFSAIVLLDHADAAGFWAAAGYDHQVAAGRFTKTA